MPKMEHVQWKALTNPNYLGSYSFVNDQDITLTIDYVRNELVIGENGRKETCVVMHFKEDGYKPLIANKTNLKTIAKLYKTPYIDEWHDRAITLYVDHNVRFGGEIVDGVRIRPTIPKVKVAKEKEYFCADCGQKISGTKGKPASYIAQYTHDKYGKSLCAECAAKAAVDKTASNDEARDLTDSLAGE